MRASPGWRCAGRSGPDQQAARPAGATPTPRAGAGVIPRAVAVPGSANAVSGGRIPREFIPSVDAGAQDALQYGILA
ncbi:hypothetical protein ABZ749_23535, partial [Micromonospora sp. NPDC047753]|uniref:hypothetical protein n=1 Tax=Micromonospora sp. NPDC047753 TaxID=3154817 RepID=UPI0033C46A2D